MTFAATPIVSKSQRDCEDAYQQPTQEEGKLYFFILSDRINF